MADVVNTQLPAAQPVSSATDAAGAGAPNGNGATASGTVDAGNGFDAKKFVPVEQLNALRSSLDQQNARMRQQLEAAQKQLAEIQKASEEQKVRGMSDDERAAYELEKEAYETEKARQEANDARQSAEYMRNLFDLKMYYASKGAPQEIVNIADPAEMQDKLLNWYGEQLKERQRQIDELKAQSAKPPAVTPPQVSTHKPGSGTAAKVKWSTIGIGSAEEAKVFEDLKQGRINVEDIDFAS